MNTPRDLYFRLRRQLVPHATTHGPCANGCGKSAAGCGTCAECLADALTAALPGVDWYTFVGTMRQSARAIVSVEQAVEDAERGR